MPLARLRILDDRQSVFQAELVIDPADRKRRVPKVAEFPRAIKIDGIDYDVIVYVVLVNMSTDDKGVVALRQLHGKLAPNFVCLLRCDLTGLEGLPQVVGDHVVAAPPAR